MIEVDVSCGEGVTKAMKFGENVKDRVFSFAKDKCASIHPSTDEKGSPIVKIYKEDESGEMYSDVCALGDWIVWNGKSWDCYKEEEFKKRFKIVNEFAEAGASIRDI